MSAWYLPVIGTVLGALVAPRLRDAMSEERILQGALGAPIVPLKMFGVFASLGMAFCLLCSVQAGDFTRLLPSLAILPQAFSVAIPLWTKDLHWRGPCVNAT